MPKDSQEVTRDEHATISNVDGKKVFVIDNAGNQIIDFGGDKLPIIGNNPSLALTYTSGNLTTLTKTISGTDYEKTLAYDVDGNLETVSTWSEV